MLKEEIASRLEVAFNQHGFAQPSVSQLTKACNVSLRTLYKYYPSKEEMIIGALTYRHKRYIAFLLNGSPPAGIEATLHIFDKLQHWMSENAPHGCLSMNAMTAFPDNAHIKKSVSEHKEEVRMMIGQQSNRPDLSTSLFLLHEGASSTWTVIGNDALISAKYVVSQLMKENR